MANTYLKSLQTSQKEVWQIADNELQGLEEWQKGRDYNAKTSPPTCLTNTWSKFKR